MGRDKAMLVLSGKTLLGRAVDCLRQVEALKDGDGRVTVTVVGERTELEGADRAIVDRYEGCGPMGGMEAALRDLNDIAGDTTEWAFFVPVDMPFLPPALIDDLLLEWAGAADAGALACHAVVGDTPQPLLAVVHRSIHPLMVEALEQGRLKVGAVLQSASEAMSLSRYGPVAATMPRGLHRTIVDVRDALWNDERLTRVQRESRHLWFSNLNRQEDVAEAETFLARQGSIL